MNYMDGVPRTRLPAVVQTLWWVLAPISFLRRMRARHGNRFRIKFLLMPSAAMISDPDDIRAVFTAEPGVLNAGEANFVLAPLVGDNSVLTLDGDQHMRQRRLLLPPFHGERMKVYVEDMREITDAALDKWRPGDEVVLHRETQQITLAVILRVVFGIRDEQRTREFRDRFDAVDPNNVYKTLALAPLARFAGRLVQPRIDAFETLIKRFDDLLYEEIANRRADPHADEYDDILSMLLQARDEAGNPMTDEELRDELVTLVIAGHETTATSLAWTVELLLRNRVAMERAVAEAREGDSTEYIDAVIKESLRLRPILPMVARRIKRPFTLADGTELPVGTGVLPNIFLAQRNPEVYDSPEAFRPERFVGVQPDTYSWLPFGGGIRRCIGASFALVEMRVVLQRLLERADFEAIEPQPERVVRRAITLVPRNGVPLRVTTIRKRIQRSHELAKAS